MPTLENLNPYGFFLKGQSVSLREFLQFSWKVNLKQKMTAWALGFRRSKFKRQNLAKCGAFRWVCL
ncbi:hypothetical protein DMN64_07055 [Campylobacter upsaliensis]|nr:hypothetical protein [Campylobacter upsaliensis]